MVWNENKKWSEKKDHDDRIISLCTKEAKTTTTLRWWKETYGAKRPNDANNIKENVVKLKFGSNTQTNGDNLTKYLEPRGTERYIHTHNLNTELMKMSEDIFFGMKCVSTNRGVIGVPLDRILS